MYETHKLYSTKDKNTILEDYPILQAFMDVFLEEVLGNPPKWDIYFTTNIFPRVSPTYKDTYRMSTLELVEVNT